MRMKLFLLCFILAVLVEGSPRRNHNRRIQIKSPEKSTPWLPYYSWQQFRIDPWFLRRPGLWELGRHLSHINLAAIRRRRQVSKQSRRSKWSKLYAKHNKKHFNEVSKLNPFSSWGHTSYPYLNAKTSYKTWKSAYNYAKPSWLLQLRKKLNVNDNRVDELSRIFTSKEVGNKHFSKVSRLQWKPKQDVSYSEYMGKNGIGRLDFLTTSKIKNHKISIPEPNRLFEGKFQPKTAEGSLPAIRENSSAEDKLRDNLQGLPRKADFHSSQQIDIPGLFGHYESVGQSGFQQSKENIDGFLSSGDVDRTDGHNQFDFSDAHFALKTAKYSGNVTGQSDSLFEARGMGSGSIGNPHEDPLSQPLEQPMGQSFGQVDARSSSASSSSDGFGSIDSFSSIHDEGDDIYGDISFTDLDDSGFDYFGGFGPFDGGSFVEETDDCDGVETRSCVSDSECVCLGMYFCQEGTCSSISTSSQSKDLPPEIFGFWHEEPISE